MTSSLPTEMRSFLWQGRLITVIWSDRYCGEPNSKIGCMEIIRCSGRPISISKTGYRSHFPLRSDVEESGGPVNYAVRWLNREA